MSVAGIDFGNLNLLIGQTSKGGVDVILNESSNRQTATYVSVTGKQRFLGDAAAAMARSNIKNTVSQMKLLVGRQFDDAAVQKELATLPFQTEKMANGGVGISLTYNDEPLVVSAEHAMAMMLVKAKDTSAKANGNLSIGDAVLAVPHWFTESQRRGILNACDIAALNCLKVTNESCNIALSYGIFKSAKKLFSETDPTRVMFIDIGFRGYCVTIVDFIQENMKVLATVCDTGVGGKQFDDVIIEFLAETFQAKTKIDVRGNKKAMLKLQAAAEKAKKTLSPAGVNEVNVSVECLAEDIDLAATLTRSDFEDRAADLVARLRAPIEQCLQEAGLKKEDISEVEVVGGTTRVNVVKRTLSEIMGLDAAALNYGLKTTMNADEAVARGGALQCAMVSSRVKVKPFNIVDRLPYGILAQFEGASAAAAGGDDDEEGTAATGTSVSLYSRNDEVPHKPRRLTFKNKVSDFSVTLCYDDAAVALLPEGESRFVAKFTVRIPAGSPSGDVRVTWNLDKHGLVFVQSAQLMEEIPYSPEEIAAAEAAAAAAAEGKEGEGKEAKEGDAAAPKPVDITKKRFKKIDLQVDVERSGLTKDDVKAAIELEAQMANEDRLIMETADKRNELESYIYAMRDKIDGSLSKYGSPAEKDELKGLLTTAEDWLYGDGFDSTKTQYAREIEKLRSVGDKIERRLSEEEGRPAAIDSLKKQLEMCKSFASKYGDDYAHIEEDERDKLRAEVRATEEWMYDLISQQGNLATHADPVLTAQVIHNKRDALFKVSNPIMTKPKPTPKPVETPAPAAANPPPAPEGGADAKGSEPNPAPAAAPEEAGAAAAEPMDQAKGGPEEDSKEAGESK